MWFSASYSAFLFVREFTVLQIHVYCLFVYCLFILLVNIIGKPTLAKAEEVKLKKEAKELSAANIISSETGKSRDGETTHLLPIMA